MAQFSPTLLSFKAETKQTVKQHRRPESVANTGFGNNSSAQGGRLTNKDGTVNLEKTGLPFWKRISLYHSLLRMHRGKFFLVIFLFYTTMNLLFAGLYILVGVENLQGVEISNNEPLSGFLQAFFFSSQTLTTVGYGHISPHGLWANVIASLESFFGILSFALVTGLLYGRFTRPKAYLMFSEQVIIAPHQGRTALMCRMASYKNNHLTEVEASITLVMHQDENGKKMTRFYVLKPEIGKVNSLALNWTLVHLIDEESPLYGMDLAAMEAANIEILLFVKGFDDHFSNTVQQRTSYTFNELVYGARFLPMYRRSDEGDTTLLELQKISAWEPASLPVSRNSAVNA